MPVDRSIVGNVAADVMGQLEERFGDDENANVRAVFLIAAVDYAVDSESHHTEVRWGVSAGLPKHEAISLLEYVKPYLQG
jgi:hypothetical protein